MSSTIEQILLAELDEGGQRVPVGLLNGARVLARHQASDHVVVAHQAPGSGKVDLVRVEFEERRGQLNSQSRGIEEFAVHEFKSHALNAHASGYRFGGREAGRVGADAGNLAAVQVGGQFAAINETGPDLLKWSVGSP